jgi:hypothetical protein
MQTIHALHAGGEAAISSHFHTAICCIFASISLVASAQETQTTPPPTRNPALERETREGSSKPADSQQLEVKNNLLAREIALAFSHPEVEQELELVAYQKEQLRDLFYDYQKTMNEVAQQAARIKLEDRVRLFGELNEKIDQELDRVLLPNQRKRLRQIGIQSLAPPNPSGIAPFFSVLANQRYREYLGISSETASRLQVKLREENDKFAEEVARLRQAALDRVWDTLSPAERESLEAALGAGFDFGNYQLGRGGIFQRADDK